MVKNSESPSNFTKKISKVILKKMRILMRNIYKVVLGFIFFYYIFIFEIFNLNFNETMRKLPVFDVFEFPWKLDI